VDINLASALMGIGTYIPAARLRYCYPGQLEKSSAFFFIIFSFAVIAEKRV
jgi:hypothetical protein